jgi:UDPglucose 6-dehydrogenase
MISTIGIIGQGFVGTAVRKGFNKSFNVATYDKKDLDYVHVWSKGGESVAPSKVAVSCGYGAVAVLLNREIVDGPIFVCLPTPMREDGSCDTSIVESVLSVTNERATKYHPLIVIKSTMPLGMTDKYQDKFKHLRLCFSPEFLTEANADSDFANQDRIICGVPDTPDTVEMYSYYEEYRSICEAVFPTARFEMRPALYAECVKYFTNCALACRVSLANEFSQIVRALVEEDADTAYLDIIAEVCNDSRVGLSHWLVPGPDGRLGFGGSCFPKDLNALIHIAKSLGVDPKCLSAAWEKNLEVRPGKDWEKLKGRAVV